MPRSWYTYIGNGSTGSYTLPGSYSLFQNPNFPVPSCTSGPALCAIYAPDGGTNPSIISTRIQNYIATGLANQVSQPQTGRVFVKLKATA